MNQHEQGIVYSQARRISELENKLYLSEGENFTLRQRVDQQDKQIDALLAEGNFEAVTEFRKAACQ